MANAFSNIGAVPGMLSNTKGQTAASNVIFGNKPAIQQLPAIPTPPTSNAPVKSQVIQNADGSKHTTIYDNTSKTPAVLGGGKTSADTVANQETGTQTTPQQIDTKPDITYPGMIGGAVTAAQGALPIGQQAKDIATKYSRLIGQEQQNLAGQLGGIETSGTTLQTALGREGVLNRTSLARQQALAQQQQGELEGVGKQLTAQQQAQQGLTNVAGLTPEALRYGGAMGGTLSPNVQAQNYANDVISGKRTLADAQSAMGLYGTAGQTFLNNAIKTLQPDFNFAQATTLAAQQGSIIPAYTYAKTALGNLQTAVGNLATGQNTNIPIINAITQGFSTTFGVGSEGVRNYRAALEESRNALQKVLASVQGGTPTDYVGQSHTVLPDNATPNDIQAAINTLDTLGKSKVDIYSKPGGTQMIPAKTTTPTTSNTVW